MKNVSDTGNHAIEWARIKISGADAGTYLQGQITQDVVNAPAGAWTFVLQPDSSVLSLGWLSSDGPDFLLDVSEATLDDVASRLRRFILRSKVEVEVVSCVNPVLKTYSEAFAINYPIQLPEGDSPPHSFGPDWIARAISFTKGCYTGQELVGRLDARQAPVPFRIVRLRSQSLAEIELVVHSGGQKDKQSVLWGYTEPGLFNVVAVLHRTCLTSEFVAQHPLVEFLDIKL
jgi:folate-binding protein YgfZ